MRAEAARVEVGGVVVLLEAEVLHAREQHVEPLLLRVSVRVGVRARGRVRVSTSSRASRCEPPTISPTRGKSTSIAPTVCAGSGGGWRVGSA